MVGDEFLRHQHYLFAGETLSLLLEPDDELIIPPHLQGKVEVRSVGFGNCRAVVVEALESGYIDPCDLKRTPDDVLFDRYRSDLEEFLGYRAQLAEEYEEL